MVFSIVAFVGMNTGEVFALFASTFILGNIPTIVFVVIYFACREKLKSNKEMEKMNIQEL